MMESRLINIAFFSYPKQNYIIGKVIKNMS